MEVASPSFPPRKRRKKNKSNRSRNLKVFQSDNFQRLAETPYFIDKSLLIKEVLNAEDYIILTAPRKFGKSSNLNMLKNFFMGLCEETFRKCKIYNEPEWKHFGSKIVIELNFGLSSRTVIRNGDDAHSALKKIMHHAYSKFEYLTGPESKLDENDKSIFRSWTGKDHESNSNDSTIASLLQLSKFVFKHHGKKSVLMIDEFDFLCCAALFHVEDEKILDEIIRIYSLMIGQVIKFNTDYIERAILTGVTSITCSNPSPLGNFEPYEFLKNPVFYQFYGITDEDFEDLMTRPCCESIDQSRKDKAKRFYNGYRYEEHGIYCTWSVLKFICKGKVEPYWEASGIITGLYETMKSNNVKEIMEELLTTEYVEISTVIKLSYIEFSKFYHRSNDPNYDSIDVDILLHFLLQQGYLTVVDDEESDEESDDESDEESDDDSDDYIRVKIPNLEMRTAFKEIMRNYYTRICIFDFDQIKLCETCCSDMDLKDINSCIAGFNTLCATLNELLTKYREDFDERWLQPFLFHIFFNRFKVLVERKTGKQRDKRKRKRLDLLLVRLKDCAGFLFELKMNKTADLALETIIAKKYHTHEDIRAGKYLLIGMNVQVVQSSKPKEQTKEGPNETSETENVIVEEKKVTISFLLNTTDMTKKISCPQEINTQPVTL